MAVNAVLTSDQKLALQQDNRFQNLAKQSILDKAIYWTGQDGASPPGGDRIRWAKSRLRSQAIVVDPTQISGSFIQQFIIFLKDIQLWDNAIAPWAPNVAVVTNQQVTDNGIVWKSLTNHTDAINPVEGILWTKIGVANTMINDLMLSGNQFDACADKWMDEQIRGIDF